MRKILLGIFILFLVACSPFSQGRVADEKLAGATYTDPKTGLMWAGQDNGKDVTWAEAKSYCENYRGGGYTDWRMPTKDEVAELFTSGANNNINIIGLTVWPLEIGCVSTALFNANVGGRGWGAQSYGSTSRALPVRSTK